jgi:hypothetical protein
LVGELLAVGVAVTVAVTVTTSGVEFRLGDTELVVCLLWG